MSKTKYQMFRVLLYYSSYLHLQIGILLVTLYIVQENWSFIIFQRSYGCTLNGGRWISTSVNKNFEVWILRDFYDKFQNSIKSESLDWSAQNLIASILVCDILAR